MLGRDPEVILGGSDAVIDEELARINAWSSIFLVARLAAIVGLIAYGFYAIITLLQPKRRKPNRSFWGDLGIYTMLFIIAVAMAFPLVFSIASSLKPLDELFRFPPKVFPDHPTFDNFSDLSDAICLCLGDFSLLCAGLGALDCDTVVNHSNKLLRLKIKVND